MEASAAGLGQGDAGGEGNQGVGEGQQQQAGLGFDPAELNATLQSLGQGQDGLRELLTTQFAGQQEAADDGLGDFNLDFLDPAASRAHAAPPTSCPISSRSTSATGSRCSSRTCSRSRCSRAPRARCRTVATKFSWLEDKHKPRFDATAARATTVVQTIGSSTGAYFAQHDQVLNTRTGEQFRVDGVSGNTLTVTRGIGSTAAAMNNATSCHHRLGAAGERHVEAGALGQPDKSTNYTQIFRTPFEQSGSLLASRDQVRPADWPHQARKAGIEHAKDIEYALLLGRKSLTTPGATEDRTTGGALSFISTNQTDAGGDLSEAEFNAFMLQVMRYGSGSKLAMASGRRLGAEQVPGVQAADAQRRDDLRHERDALHVAVRVAEPRLPPLLEGTKYGGYIVVVDMDEVAYRYLANDEVNRDTKVLPNRQPNDQDGRKDEYLTEIGLQFGQERTHGVLTGITEPGGRAHRARCRVPPKDQSAPGGDVGGARASGARATMAATNDGRSSPMTAATMEAEQLVEAPPEGVVFLARRRGLRLVRVSVEPIWGAGGRKVGDTKGHTVEFRDGRFVCEKKDDPDGRVLEFLRTHARNGDPNEGFWEVTPSAPAVTMNELQAAMLAATNFEVDKLQAMLEQEEAGWAREELLTPLRAALERFVEIKAAMSPEELARLEGEV
jgi:hypothetical protein